MEKAPGLVHVKPCQGGVIQSVKQLDTLSIPQNSIASYVFLCMKQQLITVLYNDEN